MYEYVVVCEKNDQNFWSVLVNVILYQGSLLKSSSYSERTANMLLVIYVFSGLCIQCIIALFVTELVSAN